MLMFTDVPGARLAKTQSANCPLDAAQELAGKTPSTVERVSSGSVTRTLLAAEVPVFVTFRMM
jgi:hypothetical protein